MRARAFPRLSAGATTRRGCGATTPLVTTRATTPMTWEPDTLPTPPFSVRFRHRRMMRATRAYDRATLALHRLGPPWLARRWRRRRTLQVETSGPGQADRAGNRARRCRPRRRQSARARVLQGCPRGCERLDRACPRSRRVRAEGKRWDRRHLCGDPGRRLLRLRATTPLAWSSAGDLPRHLGRLRYLLPRLASDTRAASRGHDAGRVASRN